MTQPLSSRRGLLAGGLGASAVTTALLGADLATAAEPDLPDSPNVDFFLRITGIPGESADAQHANEIDILSWSFGASTTVSPTDTSGGRRRSKPKDFAFVARVSKASPLLFLACATGKNPNQAVLTCRRRGGAPVEYLAVTFGDVIISSYQTSNHPVDGNPLDVVRLEYSRVKASYRQQRPDGSLAPAVVGGFDFVGNKVI